MTSTGKRVVKLPIEALTTKRPMLAVESTVTIPLAEIVTPEGKPNADHVGPETITRLFWSRTMAR